MNDSIIPPINESIENLFVVGINFKNADVATRGKFFLGNREKEQILKNARENFYDDFIVLSTCNRTEIYGSGNHETAVNLLIDAAGSLPTQGGRAVFNDLSIIKKNQEAIRHIYHVATGLDSQILGDYEILGQFKEACKMAKSNDLLSPVFERLANSTIQASKKVKSKTEISKGTVSVSYAAIEFIKEKYKEEHISILIIGTGKFGRNVSKNIQHYLPNAKLTVANRTHQKAIEFAKEYNFSSLDLPEALANASQYNVIVLATSNNESYLLDHKYFDAKGKHLIIDLSVPSAADIRLKEFDNIEVVDLDIVSTVIDRTLEKRKTFLPEAYEIIEQEIDDFYKWLGVYSYRNDIIEAKNKLFELSRLCPHLAVLPMEDVKKKINKTVAILVEELQKNGKKIEYSDLEKYFLASTSSGGKI